MTNGEKIMQAFPDLQIDMGKLEVYMWTTTHDAIDMPLDWWNAEYKEPITKNDLPENNVGKIDSTTKNDLGVDYTINGLDDFIKFGKKAFGVELTIKKSDNPDTYAKLFGTTKNDLADGKDNNVISTDCISRQEAIDTIRQLYLDLASQKAVIDILKVLPSVTPQPKHGIWQQVNKNEVNVIPEYRCSNCGAEFKGFDFDFDYCPRCGSVMEDEE